MASSSAAKKAASPAAKAAAPATAVAGTNYPVITDKKIIGLVAEYARNEARNRELRPQIEAALNGAPVACAGQHMVKLTHVVGSPGTPNTVITQAMVGQLIPGKKSRSGYTRFEVR